MLWEHDAPFVSLAAAVNEQSSGSATLMSVANARSSISTYLKEIKYLAKEFPNCNILGTAYELEDYNGIISSIKLNKIPFKNKRGVLSNYFEVASCSNPPLWSSAVVIRKTALIDI